MEIPRGNTRGRGNRRWPPGGVGIGRRFRPESYSERFFQELARRMNYAFRLENRHFEAFRFMRELRLLLSDHDPSGPRRA